MLQTAQSAAQVAANGVMAEMEQVAAKAAAKKAKKQKQKAKKQRALQQASSDTGLLTTEAMSTMINLGRQESRAAAEQSHDASAACVKEASCDGTADGSASFTARVSHQVLSCATPTQAPSPQPAKPVSTLLADSDIHSPGTTVSSAGRQTGADDELGPDGHAATSCSQPVLHDCLDSVHHLSALPADKTRIPNHWPASSHHTSSLDSSSPKSHVQSVKHEAASVTTQAVTASVQCDPAAKLSQQGQRADAGLLLCCPMTKVSPGHLVSH